MLLLIGPKCCLTAERLDHPDTVSPPAALLDSLWECPVSRLRVFHWAAQEGLHHSSETWWLEGYRIILDVCQGMQQPTRTSQKDPFSLVPFQSLRTQNDIVISIVFHDLRQKLCACVWKEVEVEGGGERKRDGEGGRKERSREHEQIKW